MSRCRLSRSFAFFYKLCISGLNPVQHLQESHASTDGGNHSETKPQTQGILKVYITKHKLEDSKTSLSQNIFDILKDKILRMEVFCPSLSCKY